MTRHARMAAATPMFGISEVVYRCGCSSGHVRVAGRLAANAVVIGVAGAERWTTTPGSEFLPDESHQDPWAQLSEDASSSLPVMIPQ